MTLVHVLLVIVAMFFLLVGLTAGGRLIRSARKTMREPPCNAAGSRHSSDRARGD
jgi:hypothetical protein